MNVKITEQPEMIIITFEKRSYKYTNESRGRKKSYKCCEQKVLEATDMQSENWWIK